MKSFAFMIDQSKGTELKGNVLHVGEKGFFRSMSSCGSCEERQLDWRIRITPNGVEDLGEKSLVPELDTVDEVIYRLANNKTADELASQEVIKFLRELIAGEGERDDSTSSSDENKFSLGMLEQSTVTHQGSDAFLCVSADEVGLLRFHLLKTSLGFYLRDVQDLSAVEKDNPCTQQSGSQVGNPQK